MLGLLRQRRWIGFTALSVFFVLLFIRLSVWQVSRLHQREAANAVERAHLSAPPLSYPSLLALSRSDPSFSRDQQWRAVRLDGHWDGAHQVLVRNRVSDSGDNGYEVITPLVPAGGGPALLVDRGWVPSGSNPSGPNSVPAAQTGLVSVTARLLPSEPSRPTEGLPAGQVLSISSHDIDTVAAGSSLPGFVVLTAERPAPSHAPQVRAGPVIDNGPHLSYAVQWVLFAVVGVGGWWTFLRREAQESQWLAARAEGGSGSANSGQPPLASTRSTQPGAPGRPTAGTQS